MSYFADHGRSYLTRADLVASADKNLIAFANRCHAEAPFRTAKGLLVKGGHAGVEDLLALM